MQLRYPNPSWPSDDPRFGFPALSHGLPGNLVPIRREDYVVLERKWGGPKLADGSDGFQIYENGGATASFAYFTIKALLILGRIEEANKILKPMLSAFAEGKYQGYDTAGKSYDWTSWEGTPNGYEGLLVDGYLTLLSAVPVPR